MTYNSSTGTTEYGACPYITRYKYNTTVVGNALYIELPSNVSILNEFMCGPLSREGELCGKCKDGYGTALYSYTLKCKQVLGTWLWMGLVLFAGTFPNNCDVLSGGDLPHKSHLLPTECPCVHESDCSVRDTTEYTIAHVH